MFSPDLARKVFDYALRGGADFAELFLEDREDVSIDYDGGVSDAAHMRCYRPCRAGMPCPRRCSS